MYLPMHQIEIISDTTRARVQIFICYPVQIKPNGCNWEESHSGVEGFAVHGVEEKAPLFRIDERPKALGLLDHLI